jgi:predicted peptidase
MFAAAIPMNGGWTQKQTQKLAKSKTAWYSLHGTDDKTYSAYLDSVVAFDIQKMKGNIHFLQVPGLGHECNDPRLFSALLWKWMYAQHRS